MVGRAEETGGRRRPGRPAQISRERIVEAAARTENLDTLTMRELAGGLGVSHGALYRWVRNREELFDLISDVVLERITLQVGDVAASIPSDRLSRLAWAMHDQFLALPGYASHLARPHQHNTRSLEQIRTFVLAALHDGGSEPELAEQHWYLFITCTVSWLAATENSLHLGASQPRFDVFLRALLRGLLTRDAVTSEPGNASSAAAQTLG